MKACHALAEGAVSGKILVTTYSLSRFFISVSTTVAIFIGQTNVVNGFSPNRWECWNHGSLSCSVFKPNSITKGDMSMIFSGNYVRRSGTSLFNSKDSADGTRRFGVSASNSDLSTNATVSDLQENFFPSKMNGDSNINGFNNKNGKSNGSSLETNGASKNEGFVNGDNKKKRETSPTAPEVNQWTTLMADGTNAAIHVPGKEMTAEEGLEILYKDLKDMSIYDDEAVERYWDTLLPKVSYLGTRNAARIKTSLRVAYRAHRGQMRKSGEPFIIHPVEVSSLLCDLRMDAETIMAGLLHDTVEDTNVTFTQVEAMFGEVVRSIVEGETKVSKLPKLAFSDYADEQAENLRQMFVAMSDDYRIIIVKLADRLHNMRTLKHMKPEKQQKISRETLDIFAPLAHRMGIWQFKSELEDIAFMYLYPSEYERLNTKLQLHKTKFSETLEKTKKRLQETLNADPTLKEQADRVEVYGRTKELYSLWLKMETKEDHNFGHIADVVALRVILFPKVENENENEDDSEIKKAVWLCYHVLGLVQHLPGFQPVPTRVKDYISFPKPNGYQALHTELMLNGQTIEVQIRTAAMHQVAEYGMAAHWAYTDEKKRKPNSRNDLYNTPWLSSIKEWQDDYVSSRDFVECVRRELLGKRVFVFLRNGKILNLARGATIIDAAFQIHTEVGLSMHGALINGKHVPFSYELQNGDVVSILTGEGKPALDWMRYAKSRSTRSKLRSYFRGKQRESYRKAGEILLLDFLARHRDLIVDATFLETPIPSTLNEMNTLLPGNTRYHEIDDLLIAIGKRHEWDFLRSVLSKLFKVPLNVLIDADEARSPSRGIYSSVYKNTQIAQDVEKVLTENDENDEDEYSKVSSSPSKMLNGFKKNDPAEDADFDHLCPECLPMIGDEIIGTRLVSSKEDDSPATVHRTACPHALRAANRSRALMSKVPLNNENMGEVIQMDNDDLDSGEDTNRKSRTRSRRRFSNRGSEEYPEEIAVNVRWPDTLDIGDEEQSFLTEVMVTSNDRKHLLADCGEAVSEIADIVKTASMTNNNISTFEFLVKVRDTDHLQELMDALAAVNSVMLVERRFGTKLL